MSSLRLHPEYGVNPTLDICFWCGEPRGVLMLGFNNNRQASRTVVINYEPCSACKDKMSQGIVIVEAEETKPGVKPGFPEIQKGLSPTGRWLVMSEQGVRKFVAGDLLDTIMAKKKVLVSPDVFSRLLQGVHYA